MIKLETSFPDALGFNPQLASEIAQCASRYEANLTLTYAGKHISIKSLIGLLALGINAGDAFVIEADGTDEKEALAALKALLRQT